MGEGEGGWRPKCEQSKKIKAEITKIHTKLHYFVCSNVNLIYSLDCEGVNFVWEENYL